MDDADEIMRRRRQVWACYYERFEELEQHGHLRRPIVPAGCVHNGHMFYLLLAGLDLRTRVLTHLNENGVNAVFHFVPLHSSDAGRRFGRASGVMDFTEATAAGLVRLPLWIGMDEDDVDRVAGLVRDALT
jgi:dTDP-4-amino-4,6-dideoxygalactose transaminase